MIREYGTGTNNTSERNTAEMFISDFFGLTMAVSVKPMATKIMPKELPVPGSDTLGRKISASAKNSAGR
jgi:hypothetical protein